MEREDHKQELTPDELRIVEGAAGQNGRAPCPACGRPIATGQDIVTSLGDVRRKAIGVTVHARCFQAIGRAGLFDLMQRAYPRRDPS